MGSSSVTSLRRLRARLAPAVKRAMFRAGVFDAVRRLAPSRKVAILRYHAICGPEGHAYADPAICVSPEAFEAHVRYLARHYNVLPLPEVVGRLRDGRPLPPNTVVFTFDDGYADNLEAARTLSRHGLSGTFYLTAGCLAGGEPFWPSEIRALIPALPRPVFRLEAGGTSVELRLATEADREAAIRTVTRLFKSRPIPVREALRERLRAAAGTGPIPSPMLRWEDVEEMQRLGMTIGAHTLTHPNLPSAGLEAARVEIAGSKARLEDRLGTEVTMFSYPNGGAEQYYTPEVQRIVRDVGLLCATTSRNGLVAPSSDLYALERVRIGGNLEDLVFALEVERFGQQA